MDNTWWRTRRGGNLNLHDRYQKYLPHSERSMFVNKSRNLSRDIVNCRMKFQVLENKKINYLMKNTSKTHKYLIICRKSHLTQNECYRSKSPGRVSNYPYVLLKSTDFFCPQPLAAYKIIFLIFCRICLYN